MCPNSLLYAFQVHNSPSGNGHMLAERVLKRTVHRARSDTQLHARALVCSSDKYGARLAGQVEDLRLRRSLSAGWGEQLAAVCLQPVQQPHQAEQQACRARTLSSGCPGELSAEFKSRRKHAPRRQRPACKAPATAAARTPVAATEHAPRYAPPALHNPKHFSCGDSPALLPTVWSKMNGWMLATGSSSTC